jgi:hydrogenase expression/formation protein HypC
VCLAIPGRVVEVFDDDNQLAMVDVAGVRRTVNVALLRDSGAGSGALEGQWVLIHVGFALARIDEQEAKDTLELLNQMGAEYEQELQELRAGSEA